MKRCGFSPIEIIIVLLVLSIIISVIFKRYNSYQMEAYKIALKYDLKTVQTVIKLYKIKNGRYPKKLSEIVKPGYLLDEKNKLILAVIKYKNGTLFIKNDTLIYDNKTGKVFINK